MQDGTAQPEREAVRHSLTSHSLSLALGIRSMDYSKKALHDAINETHTPIA